MAYPALRTAKEDDNDDFQLSSASNLTQQTNALERFCSDVALGARRGRIFHAAITFATQTNANREKKNDEILLFRSIEDFSYRFLLSKVLTQR